MENPAPYGLPTDSETFVSAFRLITEEMAETFRCKNHDYGNAYADGYRRFGPVQLLSRIYEKFCRVETLLTHRTGSLVKTESVSDTLTDMAVQCIALRLLVQTLETDYSND